MNEESDRRQEILEAAFEEFSRKGFKGATIKSIAQAAGLQSPSLIYWYFPTKEELFEAVVEARSPFFRTALDPRPFFDRPPDQVLPLLARAYLAGALQPANQKLVRLILAEAISRPEIAQMVGERLMLRVLEFLKAYLARQVELGRLRPHDTRASARLFVGALVPVVFGQALFPILQADGLTAEEQVQTAMDVFLHGLTET
ncbi:MAG: TetR/AcrR family transcriptional regulator [Chloroflexota bacterium]